MSSPEFIPAPASARTGKMVGSGWLSFEMCKLNIAGGDPIIGYVAQAVPELGVEWHVDHRIQTAGLTASGFAKDTARAKSALWQKMTEIHGFVKSASSLRRNDQ